MFNQRLAYTNRWQLLIVYVFKCNNLETMKNKHEMSGKGKTVVFPCDSFLILSYQGVPLAWAVVFRVPSHQAVLLTWAVGGFPVPYTRLCSLCC